MTVSLPLEIRFYPASPLLAPYISGYWTMRTNTNSDSFSAVYRSLPNMQSSIIFNNSTAPLTPVEGASQILAKESAYFISAADWHHCFRLDGKVDLFGIQFRHGYLRELLRTDICELNGLQIPLSDLMGSDGEQLQHQLNVHAPTNIRIALVENLLAKKCWNLGNINKVLLSTLDTLTLCVGTQRITELSDDAGVSMRQLERIYKQHLGFSPKRFAEVIRFWRSSMLLKMGVEPIDIVHLLGFADQPHFNRIFHRYAGLSPGAYTREQHVAFIQDSK